MRISAAAGGLEKLLEAERAQLPPWLVVGFGSGIAAWLALDDPRQWQAFLCVAGALALIGFAIGKGRAGQALGAFGLTAALGCALVWGRSALVAEPRLTRPVVAQVRGTVEAVDHLAARQTTRVLVRSAGGERPPRVRLSIDDDKLPRGLRRGRRLRRARDWCRRRRWRCPALMTLRETRGSRDLGASASRSER